MLIVVYFFLSFLGCSKVPKKVPRISLCDCLAPLALLSLQLLQLRAPKKEGFFCCSSFLLPPASSWCARQNLFARRRCAESFGGWGVLLCWVFWGWGGSSCWGSIVMGETNQPSWIVPLKNIAVSGTTYCKLRTFCMYVYRKYRPSFPSVCIGMVITEKYRPNTDRKYRIVISLLVKRKVTIVTLSPSYLEGK
jgi:hypothetical protein